MENIDRSKQIKYCILYFLLYMPLGTLCPLISQYFNSVGFSGSLVGITASMGTGSAIIAGFVWGKIYANSHHKKGILLLMAAVPAILALILSFMKIIPLIIALYICLYFFQGPYTGLVDSMVTSYRISYSLARSFGAAGYAITAYIGSTLQELLGFNTIFYIYAAAYACVACIILTEKEPPFYQRKDEKVRISGLLKNRQYVKLLAAAFFVLGTNIANNTYFAYLYKADGGDVSGVGFAFLLMAGSEVLFMVLGPWLVDKFRAERMLLFAMIVSVLRFGLYSTSPHYTVLLGTFFLQGMVNGVILSEFIKMINRILEPKYRSLGITVYYAAGSNLSAIVISICCGMILDAYGPAAVYRFFSIYNMVAVILFIVFGLLKPYRPDYEE